VAPEERENPMNITLVRQAIVEKRVGSINGHSTVNALPGEVFQSMITTIHDITLKETNLKIPVIYATNSIHGANYIQEGIIFPHPINQGATFNLEISQRIGSIASTETRAVGVTWNNNPVLDIGRQPLWSRYKKWKHKTTNIGIFIGLYF
jgi:beta-glucosidase